MGKRNNRSRGRNRSGNRNKGEDQRQILFGREAPSTAGRPPRRKRGPLDPDIHFLPDPLPEREYDACPLSGEKIDDIVNAIAEPYSGKPARFDRVLESIREKETVGEDERLVYLGRGAFGIISIRRGESGRPELFVRKRIQYEDSHEKYAWRRELAPGISRDYVPSPQPLSELYTREELSAFPRFDASGSAYVSRSN